MTDNIKDKIMTIEQKVKAYDEAIEKARLVLQEKGNEPDGASILSELFPELIESEDERIRKAIIDVLKAVYECADIPFISQKQTLDSYVSYLEKQGEQKVPVNDFKAKDWYVSKVDGKIRNIYHSVDKVEPKFKVGDWIVNNINKDIFLIKSINNGYCTLEDIKGNIISPCLPPCESESHIWTIEDAKDGDVLFTSSTASHETFVFKNIDEKGNAKCYFAYDSEDGFREGKYHFIGRATDCKPATKEQRDLLFQKMKEAGYEWNADKKELRKIEQKPTWKPSEEQMEALRVAKAYPSSERREILETLYEDLEQLKAL